MLGICGCLEQALPMLFLPTVVVLDETLRSDVAGVYYEQAVG